MKKKRMIVLGILGIIIILLLGGIIFLENNKNSPLITLSQFQERFTRLSKQNNIGFAFDKDCHKKDHEKYVCEFEDDFYMGISYNQNKTVQKVYYYVKNEEIYLSKMEAYLPILIGTVNSKLSNKRINEIVQKLTDIENKKADELGFLVEFKEDSNSYMTLEKEDGRYISFFIYIEAE